eukprot:SAG22_NODE_1916_length_3316_cov_6.514454_4_plen_394_part_00
MLGQWHRFFYDSAFEPGFFRLFFGFIGMLLLFTSCSLLAKQQQSMCCRCCRSLCCCCCGGKSRRRSSRAVGVAQSPSKYATLSARDSVSSDASSDDNGDDGGVRGATETDSIYAGLEDGEFADEDAAAQDCELLQMQEYLSSRSAPTASAAVDTGDGADDGRSQAQGGDGGWDIAAANRYLGMRDATEELGLGEPYSPGTGREFAARRTRVARRLGVGAERLPEWAAIAAHRLDVYATNVGGGSAGRQVRQRSSLLKAVITAFPPVSLPFLAVPLLSQRTGRQRPSVKALALLLASWVDHCVDGIDTAYRALVQALRREAELGMVAAHSPAHAAAPAPETAQLPARLVAEAVVVLSETRTAKWFKVRTNKPHSRTDHIHTAQDGRAILLRSRC